MLTLSLYKLQSTFSKPEVLTSAKSTWTAEQAWVNNTDEGFYHLKLRDYITDNEREKEDTTNQSGCLFHGGIQQVLEQEEPLKTTKGLLKWCFNQQLLRLG